jgi:hypothetical protein
VAEFAAFAANFPSGLPFLENPDNVSKLTAVNLMAALGAPPPIP